MTTPSDQAPADSAIATTTSQLAASAERSRPAPLDKEKLRIATAREKWVDRTPPVQVNFVADNGERRVVALHSDDSGHLMRLGETFGSRSPEFLGVALNQLAAGVRSRGSRDPLDIEINAGIALVAAIAPENELEAALAVQMASNHALTSDLLGRAASAESLEQMQAFGNMAVKLQRTFTAQIEALARMRGKGQQTVRVEHVTVEAGAQAIVGDVHHHGRGAGSASEKQDQSYGTSAPQGGASLLGQDPAGNGVPIPGDAERPVPHPRGPKPRRATR